MRRHFWLLILVVFIGFSLFFSGCITPVVGGEHEIPKPDEDILEAFDQGLATSTNIFGIKIFNKLLEEEENLFISPTSIATALSMTYNGARGETREAIAKVLEVEGVDPERLNENNQALLYLLQEADPSVKLAIANSLWMREGVEFDPDFVERNEIYYNASIKELDFNTPEAVEAINSWVYDRTEGLIEDIVEHPIDPNTILFLINAIYFQGDWSTPFEEEDTRDDTFFLPEGDLATVPFMHRRGEFDYYEEEGFQAVRLPYGEEERLAMYVFLPSVESGLQEFVQGFDMEHWQKWRKGFQPEEGALYLPRFSMDYEKSLRDVLKELGMEESFDANKADFFDMVSWEGEPRLFISEVKHKSYIDVDEKGTEAAAVTSVEIETESAPAFVFEMQVNRPFFFLIHDQGSEAILFMGAVYNPAEERS
ncbi:MAG: serpin family protein [Firmicutes bacterium]|jgi:serine protease inhibitor|nr:serpin family protein [Bacillota bacterium]